MDGEPISLRKLAQLYTSRSPIWDWLRAQGYERPRVGGKSGTSSTVQRLIRLSPEDSALLDDLAKRNDDAISRVVSRALHLYNSTMTNHVAR